MLFRNFLSNRSVFFRNTDLIDAMEKAMDFHGLLNEILNYLSNMEGKAANLAPVSGINLNEIRDEVYLFFFYKLKRTSSTEFNVTILDFSAQQSK